MHQQSYLDIVKRLEHLLQCCKEFGQAGMQDDHRRPLGIAAPQLLDEVVEAFLCTAHNDMARQVCNLLGSSDLQRQQHL